jgi:hypothetical protein
MIDTSPIILNQVNNKLLCKSPLQIEITVQDDVYILEEKTLPIDDVYLIELINSREQLIEEVSGYICWLWQEFVEVDEEKLSSASKRLRQRLLSKFEVIL